MDLPNDEIGISDIIDYRECAQRFGFNMSRHQPMPDRFKLYDGEKAERPEGHSYASAYGSAAHDAIEVVENEQCSDDDAIDKIWPKWQHWLEVDDQQRLIDDLATYRTRTTTGWRLVGTELEMRTPLFVHEGRTIYFRGRIDVLYSRIDNATVFMSNDYKSSRMPKTEAEVHKDVQQWSYNFLTFENFPEIETLIQNYDQLRFGVIPTRKSPEQRAAIKAWLVRQVKAMLADDLYKPTINKWCHTCPLMADCRVTHMSSEFWVNRLAALAPEKKEGRKIVVELTEEHAGFEIYVDLLPKIKNASKIMLRFVEAVETVLKEMPQEDREAFGYRQSKPPELTKFPAESLRRIQAMMGEDFYHVASISKTSLGEFYGSSSAEYADVIDLAVKTYGAPRLLAPRAE